MSSDTLLERIEHLIGERGLKPGERLPPERELAHLLGVSRPSLREAVRTMVALGRVDVRHGSGVWIQPPDVMHRLSHARKVTLRELFAMREVLEVPAAGWAAVAPDPQEVARLEEVVAEMDGTSASVRLRDLDIRFHLGIAEMAGNRFLSQTMDVLHQMLREGMETTLTIPGRLERSRVEHRRILKALAEADPAAARSAMRAHIQSAQTAGLARLAREESAR